MLPVLGDIIQKHPVLVVGIIISITIGFSIFIPGIEFKTDFEEFSPDDEIVTANTRVLEYFGQNQQFIYIYVTKEKSAHILTADAIREMSLLQNEIDKHPDVTSSFSIVTYVDMICYLEFGKSLLECTDKQIETAINDLLTTPYQEEINIFSYDDKNEETDYIRYPKLPLGRSIDSADLKNCYLSNTNDTITFTIEVYDLEDIEKNLLPVFPKVNVMEWYVSFKNSITPIEELNVTYTIAAHIEPENPSWIFGNGFLQNMRFLIDQIKTRSLLNSYKKEAYLWIQPAGEQLAIPIPLESGNISFNKDENNIQITVDLEELGMYGIAPQFGSFSLPAKLSQFHAGSRYYQTSLFKLSGGRIAANISKIYDRIFNFQSKPLLSKISNSILENVADLTWEEFDELYQMMQQSDMMPETIALKDIDSSWTVADKIPDNDGFATISYPIIPAFYQDLQINLKSILSKDFSNNQQPSSTLIFLELAYTKDYDEIIEMNTNIADDVLEIDEKQSYVTTKTTGNGIASAEINQITSDANRFIAPAIFIIIVAILFINFRRPSYVILPMLTLVVSTIWLFGAMALLDISFNVIAIALIPLILGLGVDYTVHLLHNYRVELYKGKKPGEAIKNSVTEIGTAMFLAMLTTVIAFLSFLTASIPPIREFGILLALGVIFTFLTSITLLASLRFLLDKYSVKKIKRKEQGLYVRKIMRLLSEKILCYQKLIFIVMIAITCLFFMGAIQIETGYSMDEFAPQDTPSFTLLDEIAIEFPFSSQTQNYILIEGDIATVETLQGIRETHENIRNDQYIAKNNDGTIKVSSIYSFIKQSIENNQSLIDKYNIDPKTAIPQTDEDVHDLFEFLYSNAQQTSVQSSSFKGINIDDIEIPNISLDALNGEVKTLLYKDENDFSATIIRLYLDPVFATIEGNIKNELEVLYTEINEDMASYGSTESIATGQNLINLKITNNLTESQILSTFVSIILAALVLILVYRNAMLGLIALLPVGISIIWILGTMHYIGYGLNVLTITVTSITIGIGIDYAIHATERFRFIVDKTGDIRKAVCETISHTGGALLIAALTTALGFIILIFAPIPPQQQFGLILSVTIAYSFLTSIFLMPLVIYHWAMRRQKKKGYIISNQKSINNNKSESNGPSCGS